MVNYFDYSDVEHNQTNENELLGWDVESILSTATQNERERMLDQVERIEHQLEERQELHEHALEELESQLDWYIDRLERLYKRTFGKREEKDELKARVRTLYDELREEKQEFWRDKEQLEREKRQILRELSELNTDEWITEFL